jgi:hypothetical protein
MREGKNQKKVPTRRSSLYEDTLPVRRAPDFYADSPSYENWQSVDLKLDRESDKIPLVRRVPYLYDDDPLYRELAQQINAPVVRRSSRLAAHQYSDDDDFLLAPEQIDRENSYLCMDEHPEIPRARRASARSIAYTDHTRRRNAVVQNYIYSLPDQVMRNKKIAYFIIGIMLFVMILAILLLAPFLSGISLLILILAISALLAAVVGYIYSHYQKK